MMSLDSWRNQLRGDPNKIIAGVLEGWLDRGPWQRAEAVDFLLDLADADAGLSETAANALLNWTRDKLMWDDRKRLHYGERAHAGQIADAFAILQRLDAPKAAYQFAEQHTWFESRTRPMRFDTHLDLYRQLWLATAFQQTDERFLARWLEICGRAARLSNGWEEWLRIGLIGLRKLKSSAIPPEQQALAGLLLFRRKAPQPMPKEAEQFETRQIEVLKELFARGPAYWPSVFAEVWERQPSANHSSSPTWLLADAVPRNKQKAVVNGARPSRQTREDLERRIARDPPKLIWSAVESFFREYYRYAQLSGDTNALSTSIDNLVKKLLQRKPEPDILRPMLGWARLALDCDIGDAHHWNLVAQCRIALGGYTGAKNLLWEAVRRFPHDTASRNLLAELLWDQNEKIGAEALLRKTMNDFPRDEVCRTILARLLQDRGEIVEAEALLRKTMDDFQNNPHCRTVLAELLRDRGAVVEAEALLRKTIDDFPSSSAYCHTILTGMQKRSAASDEKMHAPQFGLEKQAFSITTAPKHVVMPLAAEILDDDPLTPWAAERAPLIRLAFNFEQSREAHDALILAARSGGAAELAEAALYLLFPGDGLPLQDALRIRPDSVALRLLDAEQDAEQGLKIADDIPETESILRDLYRHEAGGETWASHFRATVLACADLTPPPVWKREMA